MIRCRSRSSRYPASASRAAAYSSSVAAARCSRTRSANGCAAVPEWSPAGSRRSRSIPSDHGVRPASSAAVPAANTTPYRATQLSATDRRVGSCTSRLSRTASVATTAAPRGTTAADSASPSAAAR